MPSKKRNQPKHYEGETDPIDLLYAQSTSLAHGFFIGNIVKYVTRSFTHPEPEASFFKALHYMVFLYSAIFGVWDRERIDAAYRCCRDAILTNVGHKERAPEK